MKKEFFDPIIEAIKKKEQIETKVEKLMSAIKGNDWERALSFLNTLQTLILDEARKERAYKKNKKREE